ncbi:MAG: hypothetical protein LQ338_005735 [Usnochroma carphineum]|nr:MAG: hypothetical protein LQ338_005735 [Usnochroma carphineum]
MFPGWLKYPPLLLLDFDSTLTTKSTLSPLLSLPTTIYNSRPPTGSSSIPAPLTAEQLSAAYISDLKAYKTSHVREKQKSLLEEYSHQVSLRPVEAASFERGRRAFADAKVTRSDIHFAAFKALSSREVVFRKGWKRLLGAVAWKGRIAIISTNWSKIWIESLIEIAARSEGLVDTAGLLLLDGEGAYSPCGMKLDVEVRANEVIEDSQPPENEPLRLRGGGQDEETHERPSTSGSTSRPKKRRKLRGSVDFGQAMVLSPKAGRRRLNVKQSTDNSVPEEAHFADDHRSSSSSSLSGLSSLGAEGTGQAKGEEGEILAEDESSADSGHSSEDSNFSNLLSSARNELPASALPRSVNSLAEEGKATSDSSELSSPWSDSEHQESDWQTGSAGEESRVGSEHDGSEPEELWEDSRSASDSEPSDNHIFVGGDKALQLDSLIRHYEAETRKSFPPSSLEAPVTSIYVGDSTPDLQPLMAADIGIVIRDEGRLKGEQLEMKKILKRLDISLAWIGDLGGRGFTLDNITKARLWWAHDFDEVVDSGIFRIEE